MALILEITEPSGARSRRVLGAEPLTMGRSADNDIVIDDPYADARHARVVCDSSGGFLLEDLGSTNGIRMAATRERVPAVRLEPGTELRIGRTVLRVRDSTEQLPPALLDDDHFSGLLPSPAEVRPRTGVRALAHMVGATTRGHFLLIGAALMLVSVDSWLGSYYRAGASAAFADVLGYAMLAAIWAGIWSVASRIIVHRFNFVAHLAVVSAAAIALLAFTTGDEWIAFLSPEQRVTEVPGAVLLFALPAAMLAAHLAFSSTMSAWQRWRAGIILAASALVIGVAMDRLDDDSFTSVAQFSGVLKPVHARWIPASSLDDFGASLGSLKVEVDQLAEER
jgi:hypothetical protein